MLAPNPAQGLRIALQDSAWVRQWARVDCTAAVLPIGNHEAELYARERTAVENATVLRRNEFSTGRRCARLALRELGVNAEALLVGPDRSPMWSKGVTGSLSHAHGYAVAIVCRCPSVSGLGIDLELTRPLDDDVLQLITRPLEWKWIQSPNAPNWGTTALFSLKESVFKCLNPLTGMWFDFHDMEVEIDGCRSFPRLESCADGKSRVLQESTALPDPHRFTVRLSLVRHEHRRLIDGRRLSAQLAVFGPLVFTMVTCSGNKD